MASVWQNARAAFRISSNAEIWILVLGLVTPPCLNPLEDHRMLLPSPVAKQLQLHRLPPPPPVDNQLPHQRPPSTPMLHSASEVFRGNNTVGCLHSTGLTSADNQMWDCITPIALQAEGTLGSQEAGHPHTVCSNKHTELTCSSFHYRSNPQCVLM